MADRDPSARRTQGGTNGRKGPHLAGPPSARVSFGARAPGSTCGTTLSTDARRRFWAKVDRTGDCWVWTGALASGYGRFKVAGRVYGADTGGTDGQG